MRLGACRAIGVTFAALLASSCGGGGGGGGGNPPGQGNRAPTFTSSGTASVPENVTGAVYTATATDPDGNPLTFSLSGGTDRARFAITASGALSFVNPPDFEAPGDADANNVYLVTLAVSDGMANATLALSVTVTNGGQDAFRVRRVSNAFNQPVYLTAMPDGSGRVFVVELGGRIRILTPSTGAIAVAPFLDVSGQISTDGERGLLGMAVAPDFQASGTFYVFLTNPAGTIEVRRYRTPPGTRDVADPLTGDVILSIAHPRSNHNGGWIDFGPDGLLYIAVGDGGGGGDPDKNGQNRNVLLAKMLRIDVASDAFPGDPARDYAIPAGNPFAASGGSPEIWAYGLRNPFRNSFDSATGNLLIADVGQNAIEEIDLMRPADGGANFGWSVVEGTQPFDGQPIASFTLPVTEYGHGGGPRQGNSVTGGYVYRGPIEALRGQYIFADFISANIWSLPVTSFALGQTIPSSQFILRNTDFAPQTGGFDNIASFGVDQTGNLYILDIDGEVFVLEPAP